MNREMCKTDMPLFFIAGRSAALGAVIAAGIFLTSSVCHAQSVFQEPSVCPADAAVCSAVSSAGEPAPRRVRQTLKVEKRTGSGAKSGAAAGSKTGSGRDGAVSVDMGEGRCDSVPFCVNDSACVFVVSAVRFAGYDKPASASKESFHVVNSSPWRLAGMRLRIEYLDLKGRMLHKRDVEIEQEIPAGETRKVDIPTWDMQKTFYYYLGNKPRRIASPYKVKITPLSYSVLP